MTGRLLVSTPETPIPPHTHAILTLSSGKELRFVDPRRFGRLSVVAPDTKIRRPRRRTPHHPARRLHRPLPQPEDPHQGGAAEPVAPPRRRQHLRRRSSLPRRHPPHPPGRPPHPSRAHPPPRRPNQSPHRSHPARRLLGLRLRRRRRRRRLLPTPPPRLLPHRPTLPRLRARPSSAS